MVEVTRAFLPLLKAAPAARIVNVLSQLGSLVLHQDPTSPIYAFKIPAYNTSKTAVNEIDVPTGAKSSVGAALLDENGATGTFTYLGKTLPW